MDEVVKWVKDILTGLGLTGLAQYTALILFFILGSGAGVLTALWKLIKKIVQFLKHRKVSRDLHPFFTAIETPRRGEPICCASSFVSVFIRLRVKARPS